MGATNHKAANFFKYCGQKHEFSRSKPGKILINRFHQATLKHSAKAEIG